VGGLRFLHWIVERLSPTSTPPACHRAARPGRSANRKPDFGVTSVSYALAELLARAQPPRLRDAGPLPAFRAEYGKAARAGTAPRFMRTGSSSYRCAQVEAGRGTSRLGLGRQTSSERLDKDALGVAGRRHPGAEPHPLG
jgi:hypothetical protein